MAGSSKFIKSAMTRNWKETVEKRITIPDHESATFEGYLNWVYSKHVTLCEHQELCEHCDEKISNEADCIDVRSLDLVKMFILGDYLNDVRFCNAIIDDFKSTALKSKCVPSLESVYCAWKSTSRECLLRELFLQQFANTMEHDLLEPWLKNQELPKDFVVDLLLLVGDRYKKFHSKEVKHSKEQLGKKCSFHTHVEDSDKCS